MNFEIVDEVGVGRWCNGNMAVFGTAVRGSIPLRPELIIYFIFNFFSHETYRCHWWSYVMTRKVNYCCFYRYLDEIVRLFCDDDEA